jgi:hypothetical protein
MALPLNIYRNLARERQEIMKKRSKFPTRNRRTRTRRQKPPRRRITRREEEDRLDALAALALMRREKLPASFAAEAEGTSVEKMRKYIGSALRRRGKDYVARPSDRLVRRMITFDARGTRPIVVRSSKAASLVARHLNAVDDALKGKPSALREFRGKKIPYNKGKFLTNMRTLRRLQDAGLLEKIKDIYWRGRKR